MHRLHVRRYVNSEKFARSFLWLSCARAHLRVEPKLSLSSTSARSHSSSLSCMRRLLLLTIAHLCSRLRPATATPHSQIDWSAKHQCFPMGVTNERVPSGSGVAAQAERPVRQSQATSRDGDGGAARCLQAVGRAARGPPRPLRTRRSLPQRSAFTASHAAP